MCTLIVLELDQKQDNLFLSILKYFITEKGYILLLDIKPRYPMKMKEN
ncbi:hypothetical protein HNQ80_003970 [Anaerosolibacter carboniphilus]|uniref:Uncharacterized protein n=1 Tax=Anaerosolibacter carboniphilus TaxID=1417629 RepID=A0A841KW19_9FIRM|nr:hypothetical protein [Anaerosolibacter carboniphilus]